MMKQGNRPSLTRGAAIESWLPALAVLMLSASSVWGDGGTVRLVARADPYRISVFTDPTPLAAGPIDVSVLVEETATGAVRTDCLVRVTLRSNDEPSMVLDSEATSSEATNKLLKAASVMLPRGGGWRLSVTIDGPLGRRQVDVPVEVLDRSPRWYEASAWFLAPLVPIGLFAVRELLAADRGRRHRARRDRM